MKRKILSWLLCLCMALTWIPASALAAEEDGGSSAEGEKAVSVTIGETTTQHATFAEAWAAATNPANIASDVVITLLKSVTEGNAEREYSNNSSTVKNITVNIPKGLKLTLNKGFSVSPANQTLTINGNPGNSTDAGENGELIVSGVPNNDRAAVEIGSDSEVPAAERSTVNIENCTITATGIPGVAAGDGNIEITNCEITSENNCGTQNWNAAVTVSPNTGVETALSITNSSLTGKYGLYIYEGVTAEVTGSTITGTESGAVLFCRDGEGADTTLTVKENSMITAPEEGVIIQEGTLDFQGGIIRAGGTESNRGTGVYLDSSNGRGADRKAIINGVVQAGRGVDADYSEGGQNEVIVKSGAEINGVEYGVHIGRGTAIIEGGQINGSDPQNGEGISVENGTVTIKGGTITGATCGVMIGGENKPAQATITNGTIKASGVSGVGVWVLAQGSAAIEGGTIEAEASGEDGNGQGLYVGADGTAVLSGGTYTGRTPVITDQSKVVSSLLKSGFAYYRENDQIITAAVMEQNKTTLGDVRTVTVKRGDPNAGGSTDPDDPLAMEVLLLKGGDFGLSWKYPTNIDTARIQDVQIAFVPANGGNPYLTDSSKTAAHGTFARAENNTGETIYSYEMRNPELTTAWPAGLYKGIVTARDAGGEVVISGDTGELSVSALNREDVAWLLYHYGKPTAEPAALPEDCNNLDQASKTAIQAVLGAGWMAPTSEGTLSPDTLVTFGQLAAVICRAKGWDVGAGETALSVLEQHFVIRSADAITANNAATDVRADDWMIAAFASSAPEVSKISYNYNTGALSWTGRNIPAADDGQYFWIATYTAQGKLVEGSGRECAEIVSDPNHIKVTKNGSTYSCTYKPVTLANGSYKIVIEARYGVYTTPVGYSFTLPQSTGTGSGTGSGSSSGSSGSSSSGGGGGGSTSSSTTKNPDGSTTTKTENKTTGTVTETTKNPDGSQTKVETKKDGTVTTTETDKSGNKTQTVEKPDGSAVTTISQKDGTSATVTTDASGKVEAQVKLPSAAVSAAKESGEAVTLPIPEVRAARNSESAPTVTVKTGTSGAVKVEIPARNVTAGTVAVLVQADGTETVLKSTVPTADGVAVALPDGATVKIVDNSKSFNDVSSSHWAESAVEFVTAREMFGGTSAETFTPEAPMTRAMLMTVLARYDGTDTNGGSVWYEKGMSWAVEKGVSDGTNPNGRITREQLAAMLWRYSGSPSASGSLDNYTDGASVSGYAREAMSWAVENGVLNGFGDGRLGPQGQATRAQVAQMLKNFVTNQK